MTTVLLTNISVSLKAGNVFKGYSNVFKTLAAYQYPIVYFFISCTVHSMWLGVINALLTAYSISTLAMTDEAQMELL